MRLEWLQSIRNPEKLGSFFYWTELLFLGLLGVGAWWFRPKPPVSGFRVREADLQNKKVEGINLSGQPHEILGLPEDATVQQIGRAYRDLMKKYHPDVHPHAVGYPGGAAWKDAQRIAEAINRAKAEMMSRARLKKKS